MCSKCDDDESENGVKAGKVPFQHYGGFLQTMEGVVLGLIKKGVEKRAAAKPKVMVSSSKKDDEKDNDHVQEIEDSNEKMYEPPPP